MTDELKPIYRRPSAERANGVRPYVGKVCRVTYRTGSYGDFKHVVVCRIVGASLHSTNGNSTGDLIIMPATPGNVWSFNGAEYHCKSIALAHVGRIEALEPADNDWTEAQLARAWSTS